MTNIKIIEKSGNKPGKTTVILAGIHGNEICGVKAFDELIPNLEIEYGKVIFIYANLEAIRQNKRFVERNLNRCFLKEQPRGMIDTLEGKTAREIIPYLNFADILLDLHTSNNSDTVPFVICDKEQIANAYIFDVGIVSFNWDLFEPGSTDYYMNQQNKPAFCLECGYVNDDNVIEIAKKAIINFLIFTKNISGILLIKKNQKFLRIKNLYKNKFEYFKKSITLQDFEKVDKNMIIGYDGNSPVFIDEGNIVLFLRDTNKINEECFLIAEETLINKDKLDNGEGGEIK